MQPPRNASAKAAPLSTSLQESRSAISRTYGRFFGIADRIHEYRSVPATDESVRKTSISPKIFCLSNISEDVESGAAKADPTWFVALAMYFEETSWPLFYPLDRINLIAIGSCMLSDLG
jgi:hypothetical protein